MTDPQRFLKGGDLVVAFWAVVLGFLGAAGFAAFRAVSLSGEDAAGRIAYFGENLLWPGVLILAGIAAVVFMGWKAELD